jgi:hypothetical protein
MSDSKQSLRKLCSTIDKLIDKKSVDKILPLLQEVDRRASSSDDKEMQRVAELVDRIRRKLKGETVCDLAAAIGEKLAKAGKGQDKKVRLSLIANVCGYTYPCKVVHFRVFNLFDLKLNPVR